MFSCRFGGNPNDSKNFSYKKYLNIGKTLPFTVAVPLGSLTSRNLLAHEYLSLGSMGEATIITKMIYKNLSHWIVVESISSG